MAQLDIWTFRLNQTMGQFYIKIQLQWDWSSCTVLIFYFFLLIIFVLIFVSSFQITLGVLFRLLEYRKCFYILKKKPSLPWSEMNTLNGYLWCLSCKTEADEKHVHVYFLDWEKRQKFGKNFQTSIMKSYIEIRRKREFRYQTEPPNLSRHFVYCLCNKSNYVKPSHRRLVNILGD